MGAEPLYRFRQSRLQIGLRLKSVFFLGFSRIQCYLVRILRPIGPTDFPRKLQILGDLLHHLTPICRVSRPNIDNASLGAVFDDTGYPICSIAHVNKINFIIRMT